MADERTFVHSGENCSERPIAVRARLKGRRPTRHAPSPASPTPWSLPWPVQRSVAVGSISRAPGVHRGLASRAVHATRDAQMDDVHTRPVEHLRVHAQCAGQSLPLLLAAPLGPLAECPWQRVPWLARNSGIIRIRHLPDANGDRRPRTAPISLMHWPNAPVLAGSNAGDPTRKGPRRLAQSPAPPTAPNGVPN